MHILPLPAKHRNAPQLWQLHCSQAAHVFGWQQENPVGAQRLLCRPGSSGRAVPLLTHSLSGNPSAGSEHSHTGSGERRYQGARAVELPDGAGTRVSLVPAPLHGCCAQYRVLGHHLQLWGQREGLRAAGPQS